MNYILDTDILIYFLKGHEPVVRRIVSVPVSQLYITIINHSELLFGAYHSKHKKLNLTNIQAFLKRFNLLPFCENASLLFAEEKASLKVKGIPLADMDLMIASIALQNQMTLVTNNLKHFERIKKLKLENWSK